jgi:uncharacterized protein (DUF2062 family)
VTEPFSNPVAEPAPTFWHRRVVVPVIAQLTQGITPAKIALTLSVGSACALFPILGTTTLLCIVVGVALKLNQPLIQLVNALFTVVHVFVVYGLIRLGDLIFGVAQPRFSVSEFVVRRPHTIPNLWVILINLWRDHGIYFHRLGEAALHALVAWAIIAPFWIMTIYRLSHPALIRAAQRRGSFISDVEKVRRASVGGLPKHPAS